MMLRGMTEEKVNTNVKALEMSPCRESFTMRKHFLFSKLNYPCMCKKNAPGHFKRPTVCLCVMYLQGTARWGQSE